MPFINLLKRHLTKFLLLAAWLLFVLYPNPWNLVASVYRLKNPPVIPFQVAHIAMELEGNTPNEIEQFVYTRVPYQFDWEVYNMPWYFPTLDEILQNESGDCKSRYLLFASLMEELNTPYQKNISLTHIWVGYEGKIESNLENLSESFVTVDHYGQVRLSLPRPDIKRSVESFYRGFWKVMPLDKKILLLTGFPIAFVLPSLQTLRLKDFQKSFPTRRVF